MATLRRGWLLSILLVNVPHCFAPGPPDALSPPECCIPCGGENNCADIHCSWNSRPDPQIPTYYSLHWKPANSEEEHVINGTILSWIILREHFPRGELHVWVQAKNQYGSNKSEEAVFDTANINKMPPPNVSFPSHEESLGVSWESSCDEHHVSVGVCDIRYRIKDDHIWLEDKVSLSYTVDDPQPATDYEFQVRCSCDPGVKSDWSDIAEIRSTEKAPVGELDVWRDCGISQASSDCVLTWKRLPISQARGVILGYGVKLLYNNDTVKVVNVSTAESNCWLVEETQCHFTTSLKDASLVSVSAYNALGATVPSSLAMPVPGEEKNGEAIRLKMSEENLTVSWDLPSQPSDNLKEYVVQYKHAGSPPGRGFHWIKVNKSQTTVFFKGQYEWYKPYQVSLFTVSHSNKVHHLSSVIGYSLQGIPSRVPSFQVFSIAATGGTMSWESVPLCEQNGVILYYQIIVDDGVDGQNVYNVSYKSKTFKLQHLNPEQDYEVRIRAVTVAGPGANETAKFKTKQSEDIAYLIPVVLGISFVVVICAVVASVCVCRGEDKLGHRCFYFKVPDARNSYIIRHMKHQINEPLPWICIAVYEPDPTLSLLEVVEIQPRAFESSPENSSDPDGLTRPVVRGGQDDQREETVTEECHRTDRRYGREEYSKMIDSDEERDREEDCWSSSEEGQSTSGYEKHFMPTALEVLEV
ncbi:interleukin 12 receptor, beta 2a, like isoform X2 [Sebastes fasciatus]|uniref:interleukin 12 receptor, beta 2a, like isoform X2 n=1 Tax=Sebastes fasciatus TaxID=394691 RepID=UPI003D9EAF51